MTVELLLTSAALMGIGVGGYCLWKWWLGFAAWAHTARVLVQLERRLDRVEEEMKRRKL